MLQESLSVRSRYIRALSPTAISGRFEPMGRKGAAAEAFREALKLNPDYAPAKEGLRALD